MKKNYGIPTPESSLGSNPAMGPENQSHPMSFGQKQQWVLFKFYPESLAYYTPSLFHVRGTLDLDALRYALDVLADRYDAIRMRFADIDDEPRSVVLPNARIPLEHLDLSDHPEAGREVEKQRALEEFYWRPFDLARDPLIRVLAMRLGPDTWDLVINVHHAIMDMYSRELMVDTLTRAYGAFLEGREVDLPPVGMHYADYCHWQREWVKTDEARQMLDFWRDFIGGQNHYLDLPADRPRPPRGRQQGDWVTLPIPLSLRDKVHDFSVREVLPERLAKAAVATTMTAVYALLLHRLSGQDDIVIGNAFGNRREPGQLDIFGYCVNILPVPFYFDKVTTFRELLKQVQDHLLKAHKNQKLPFSELVQSLKIDPDLRYNPLFQTGIAFEEPFSLPLDGFEEIEHEFVFNKGAKLDLNFSIQGWNSDHPWMYFEFDTDLFDRDRMERFARSYLTLLEDGLAHPDKPIAKMKIMPEEEKRLLLETWNRTTVPFDRNRPFPRLFEEQAQAFPEATAIEYHGRRLTYGELDRRANVIANRLLHAGVEPGNLVGLCVERSPEMVAGLLGIMKTGGAYLPLDADYPRDRLAFMISDSGAETVLTQTGLRDRLPDSLANVVFIDEIDTENAGTGDIAAPEVTIGPDSLAYIIYTSGSTGTPKGVALNHAGLANLGLAQTRLYNLDLESRVLQFASLSFDASIWEILLALKAGGTLVLASRDEVMPGRGLGELLKRERITCVTLPPTVLATLPEMELPDLDTLIVAGESCPASLVHRWASGRRFFNAYGPTESTVCATVAQCVDDGNRPTIGRPIANTRVYLLDSHLQPVPVGVTGELCIAGVSLARGYLNRPELTDEKFVPNPFADEPGARLYRTGDLARWRPDGTIDLAGRSDTQVKVRGFRIELGEIEAALLENPDIRQAVVVPHGVDGGPADRLIAYIVPEKGDGAEALSFAESLKTRLPDYMIPSAFITLEKLPRTPSDKIDRKALPDPGTFLRPGLQTGFADPTSDAERIVAEIWKQVLQVDRVGLHDNFFDLGGHSLALMAVKAKLEDQFNRPLETVDMFKFTTVQSLACHLGGGDDGAGDGESRNRAGMRQQRASMMKKRSELRKQRRK